MSDEIIIELIASVTSLAGSFIIAYTTIRVAKKNKEKADEELSEESHKKTLPQLSINIFLSIMLAVVGLGSGIHFGNQAIQATKLTGTPTIAPAMPSLTETSISISRPIEGEKLYVQQGTGNAEQITISGSVETSQIKNPVIFVLTEVDGCKTIQEFPTLDEDWELNISIGNPNVLAENHLPQPASVQVFLLEADYKNVITKVDQCSTEDLGDAIMNISKSAIAHSKKIKFEISGYQ